MAQARQLPGYLENIHSTLEQPIAHPKHELVVYTANRIAQLGPVVEFASPLSREGKRVADLRVSGGSEHFWIECKRKNELGARKLGDRLEQEIIERASRLMSQAPEEYDIQIAIIGGDEGTINQAIDLVGRMIAEKKFGKLLSHDLGTAIHVAQGPPPPLPGLGMAEGSIALGWLHKGPIFGEMIAAVKQNKDGTLSVRHAKRVTIYTLDSHGFKNVFNSFQDALGQIPKGETGCVQVGVDCSNLDPGSIPIYLSLVCDLLATRVWRGQNKRVVALGLRADPRLVLAEEGDCRYPKLHFNQWRAIKDNCSDFTRMALMI